MIEKQDNMRTLSALGSTNAQIRNIFALEGIMIIMGGALAGLFIGFILCFLQQFYGIIRMGNSDGSFIIDAYPVILKATDIAIVLVTVLTVGTLSVLWATRKKFF